MTPPNHPVSSCSRKGGGECVPEIWRLVRSIGISDRELRSSYRCIPSIMNHAGWRIQFSEGPLSMPFPIQVSWWICTGPAVRVIIRASGYLDSRTASRRLWYYALIKDLEDCNPCTPSPIMNIPCMSIPKLLISRAYLVNTE